MGKRILVTGAGGFIGSHMARMLCNNDNFVRGVDIVWNDYFTRPYCSEEMSLDLRDYNNCLYAIKDIDNIYHMAADMGGIGYISTVRTTLFDNNMLVDLNMLRAAAQSRAKLFFFSSSACVYPAHKQNDSLITPLREDDAYPADPDQFYGWAKLFTEKLCEAYRKDYNLNIKIARYHNIYGPHCSWEGGKEKAPAAICRKVAEAPDPGKIEIWGDGNQTRSFCYIDDCIKGTYLFAESDFKEILNIGSDELVTINELADIVIRVSGKRIAKGANLSKVQGVRGRNSDNTLIKKVLGWAPSIGLEEGIKRTYPWIAGQVRLKSMQKMN